MGAALRGAGVLRAALPSMATAPTMATIGVLPLQVSEGEAKFANKWCEVRLSLIHI